MRSRPAPFSPGLVRQALEQSDTSHSDADHGGNQQDRGLDHSRTDGLHPIDTGCQHRGDTGQQGGQGGNFSLRDQLLSSEL